MGGGEGAGVREIRATGMGGGDIFLSEDGFPDAVGGGGKEDVAAEGEDLILDFGFWILDFGWRMADGGWRMAVGGGRWAVGGKI